MAAGKGDPLHRIETIRNLLALFLVGSFVGSLIAFTFISIPGPNKDVVTYMVGQLSGMATTVLGFYFVNKIGQDALDAKRTETQGKLADAVVSAVNAGPAGTGDGAALHPGDNVTLERPGAEQIPPAADQQDNPGAGGAPDNNVGARPV